MADEVSVSSTARFWEVALFFLKLGATAWGGPAVSEAMMHDEAVTRRKWLDNQSFLDILGATNLIPGPNAVELAMHIGLIHAGWPGFFAAGILFILPGTVMVLFLAWVYVTYGSLPEVSGMLYGIKPVVIAIIIRALITLGKKAFQKILLAAVGIGALALYLFGVEEILLLFIGAGVVLLVRGGRRLFGQSVTSILFVPSIIGFFDSISHAVADFSNATLFWTSLKIGAFLYGTGYVLVAFARSEFVNSLGWITNAQLIDAIAVGQALPGPLSKSLVFIGYIVGGIPSALIASAGFYLPSFLLVALISRIVILVRKTWWAAAFIDGVNVAALGLMAGAAVDITRAAVVDIFSGVLAIASLVLIFRFKISSLWVILGGGTLGIIYRLVFGS